MTVIVWFLHLFVGVLIAAAQSPAAPARFDFVVREDFFAGFGGDAARLQKAMDTCERVLADDPSHAEALVWHGSGLMFEAGMAFQNNDAQTGMDLFRRGLAEMDSAVSIAPDNVGVRIPRGAALLQATRSMDPATAAPLVHKAIDDYERTLAIQGPIFATLGDHPKGELLFGLAEAYSRLGDPEKARAYFERLIADAPGSGQTPKARQWLATGTLPATRGMGCVGCHK